MTLGNSFTWAFKDPEWLAKMLVQGLIVLIPIIGWIAMLGWLMMAIDNARAGKNELPPAGFHLVRGVEIFVVLLIYGLVLSIPAIFFFVLGAITTGRTNEFGYSASPLFALGWVLAVAANLLTRFLLPVLILTTNRSGIAGGLDVTKVWRMSTVNVANTIVAAVIVWAASVIGGFGIFLCFIPLIFTIPYENTITAGAVVWFEKEQSGAPTPSTAPA